MYQGLATWLSNLAGSQRDFLESSWVAGQGISNSRVGELSILFRNTLKLLQAYYFFWKLYTKDLNLAP